MKRSASILFLALLTGACGDESATAAGDPEAMLSAEVRRDIATLRAGTAQFHDLEKARQAGYAAQFPPGCFTTAEGAMGFHYLNESLVGSLDPAKPQLVMYEPQRDGSLELVGVEFLAPGTRQDTPPVLFGQDFGWNADFEVWVLHVWAWKQNPAGMFAGWNPRVSCTHAGGVAAAPHH